MVRSAKKLDKMIGKNPNHDVIEGSVFNAEDLKRPFSEADAVLSTLGGKFGSFKPTSIFTDSSSAIIEAARSSLPSKRVIICTGQAVHPEFRHNLPFNQLYNYPALNIYLKSLLDNLHLSDRMFIAADDIKWTLVAPPYLVSKPDEVSDKQFAAREWTHFNVGFNYAMRGADVARYLLKVAEQDLHVQKQVAISIDDYQFSEAVKRGD